MRLALFAILLTGCGDNAEIASARTICIADPTPHLIAGGGCTSDADCASGLSCQPPAIESLVCHDPMQYSNQCRRSPRTLGNTVLRRGFGTIHAMLAAFQKSPPAITWTPPGETGFVACAVFRCPPSFNDGTHEDDATTRKPRSITNFDACVLLFFVEDAQEGGVRLAASNQYPRQAVCKSGRPEEREVIEQLSFGCWAYDDSKLIAASDLQPLQPADLASVVPRIPTDAACAVDGADCYDGDHQFFGICGGAGGPCRHRCMDAEDCEAAARYDGDNDSASCTWTCLDVPNSEVGVCATTDA